MAHPLQNSTNQKLSLRAGTTTPVCNRAGQTLFMSKELYEATMPENLRGEQS